ncbi:aldo/keto reductase [Actinomadura sp. CNU-125]|uniref:aldo/keto reductase n=1 Tax=Actinomadura sp. CNU-125 TaxID=1904961 RepID=UPI00095AE1E3|nr:aldo/keto reductase [Actinomadura sp. CNU-125]OLT24069.1 aldo/keto reductase [Actinomadura sp. CNU-125]
MSILPTRSLGRLEVSAIGFGAMVLSPGVYGEVDDERGLTALRHAFDHGAAFVDTSDGYGVDGHNERLVGRALRGRRDDVAVATKFGFNLPDGVEPHPFPVGFAFGELAVNCDPRHVRGYAETSLRNLGTDVIDLYYPHFPDPQVPIEDTAGAVGELVSDGLVRYFGLSNVTADQLRRAHAVHPVQAVQTEWSMWRPVDPGLLAAARQLGVGLVAWSPLGAGFLTGTVDKIEDGDFRKNNPKFDDANLAANRDSYAAVREIAADLGVSPGRLALAWLLHRGPDVVPIPGSRTPAHIEENLAAARVELSADVLARIDGALSGVTASGGTLLR